MFILSSVMDSDPPFGAAHDIPTDEESDGEDGLFCGETLAEDDVLDDNDGFGNDNDQVDMGSDAYSWKIDHSKGDHKLKGERLARF